MQLRRIPNANDAKKSKPTGWFIRKDKSSLQSTPDANDAKKSTTIEWVQKAVEIVRLGKTSRLIGVTLSIIGMADAKHQDLQVGIEVNYIENGILNNVVTTSMDSKGIFSNYAITSLTMADGFRAVLSLHSAQGRDGKTSISRAGATGRRSLRCQPHGRKAVRSHNCQVSCNQSWPLGTPPTTDLQHNDVHGSDTACREGCSQHRLLRRAAGRCQCA